MLTSLAIACVATCVTAAGGTTSASLRRTVCGPFAQWCVQQWTVTDGLPDVKVTRITVDAAGGVRCQTAKGPAAFDGKRWKVVAQAAAPPPKTAVPENLPGVVPFLPATCGVRSAAGDLWIGTPRGVCRWDGKRWRAYHSRRWLPDDRVIDVALAPDGSAWVATRGGVARIYARQMTLADKAEHFLRILRARHLRRGLVGQIHLAKAGRFEAYRQPSSDNDGLWTALYVAAESFRYAVTRRADAKANATESVSALLFLEQVTSLPGFVARSYLPRGEGFKHGDGIWYPSADGKWDWKGDTSSDELDGHFLAYGIYYDLVDDADARRRVAATTRRIMDRIIDGGWMYHGPKGRRTRWGVWAPEKLNHDPRWLPERGLNSLGVLSYLKVTHHLTGDEKYHRLARELIDKHGYARNTILQKINVPGVINHSDDELAFVSYYNLLRLEKAPALRRIYLESIERSWQIERPEHSPLFNFIYGSAASGGLDLAESVEWLRDFPLDLVYWGVDNRGRRDLPLNPVASRFGRPQAKLALPPSERSLMRWNGNPYALGGGGGGHNEDDGTVWLLPYWMGRYHGFVVEGG